nr:uncharacterized protein LOC129423284 [Misgurnus anguillicaudatus]
MESGGIRQAQLVSPVAAEARDGPLSPNMADGVTPLSPETVEARSFQPPVCDPAGFKDVIPAQELFICNNRCAIKSLEEEEMTINIPPCDTSDSHQPAGKEDLEWSRIKVQAEQRHVRELAAQWITDLTYAFFPFALLGQLPVTAFLLLHLLRTVCCAKKYSEIFLVTYITYFTAEDCSAAVQTSSAAANVPHLPVSQSLKGPKDSSAAVQTSSAAANDPHLSVSQSLKGPKDSSAAVQTSSAAANDPHLPVSQSLKGPKDSSAAVQTSSAAANVPHLPVSQSLKGPKDSSAAVQPLLQQPMSLICLSHNHLKVTLILPTLYLSILPSIHPPYHPSIRPT